MKIFDTVAGGIVPGAIKTSWNGANWLPVGYDGTTPYQITADTTAAYLTDHPPDTVPTCDVEIWTRLGATDEDVVRQSLVIFQAARQAIGPVGPIIPYGILHWYPPSQAGLNKRSYPQNQAANPAWDLWTKRHRQHAAVAQCIFIDAYLDGYTPSELEDDLQYIQWQCDRSKLLGDWPRYAWVDPKFIFVRDGVTLVPLEWAEQVMAVLARNGVEGIVLWQDSSYSSPMGDLLSYIGSDTL